MKKKKSPTYVIIALMASLTCKLIFHGATHIPFLQETHVRENIKVYISFLKTGVSRGSCRFTVLLAMFYSMCLPYFLSSHLFMYISEVNINSPFTTIHQRSHTFERR